MEDNYESKRTIEEVFNLETGKLITASAYFSKDEAIIIRDRRIQQEAITGIRKPKFVCPFCRQVVKISGRLTQRGQVSFFAHLHDSDDCEIKTDGTKSKEEIEALKYHGSRESDRHKELKWFIETFLGTERSKEIGVDNVKCEEVFKSKNPLLNWRKPDVYAELNGKRIVFELQLSTTFLSVIVARDIFYRLNDTYIIWVFNFDENEQYVNLENLMCKDIYYANKRNAFILDKEAQARSMEADELILKCIWFEPIVFNGKIVKTEKKEDYIKLSDLKFDEEEFKLYYKDADKLFLPFETDALAKRKKFEDEKKEWLKLIEEKTLAKQEEKRKEKEAKLEEEKELLNKTIQAVQEGIYPLTLIKKYSKWGFEANGLILIEPIYNYAEEFGGKDFTIVKRNRKFGCINKVGEETIPCIYHEIYPSLANCFIVRVDKQWLVVDINNNIIKEFEKKTKITPLNDMFYLANIKTKIPTKGWYGWYDKKVEYNAICDYKGDFVLGLDHFYIEKKSFSNFEYIVDYLSSINSIEEIKESTLYYLEVEKNDNSLLVVFFNLECFSRGLVHICNSDRWGMLNIKGEKILDCKFDAKVEEMESLLWAKQNGFWGCYDKKGIEIQSPKYSTYNYTKNKGAIKVEQKSLFGFLDLEGKEVVSCQFTNIDDEEYNYYRVEKDALIGYLDHDLNLVLPCKYQELSQKTDKRRALKAKVENLWGYIVLGSTKYTDGTEIIPCIYEEIFSFNQGYAIVKRNGFLGCVNNQGEEVVDCQYDDMFDVYNNESVVVRGKLYGIVNTEGEEVLGCDYDDIVYFYYDTYIIKKNGLWGLCFEGGKVALETEYDFISCFISTDDIKNNQLENEDLWSSNDDNLFPLGEELIRIKKKGKWGLLDSSLEFIVPCIYDRILEKHGNYIVVESDGKFGVIDIKGNVIISVENEKIIFYKEGKVLIQKNELCGCVDCNTGDMVIPFMFDYIETIKNNLFKVFKGTKVGLYNDRGEIILDCKYDDNFTLELESIKTSLDGKIGLVDWNGNILIDFKYEELLERTNEYWICCNKKWGVIGTDGEDILKPLYEQIINAINWKEERIYRVISNNKQGLVRKNNEILIPIEYHKIEIFDKNFLVKNKQKYGLYLDSGKKIIPCDYDKIIAITENLFKVKENEFYGLYNRLGNKVVPPEYDSIELSHRYNDSRLYIKHQGMFGYYDPNKEFLLKPLYHFAEKEKDGLIKVRLDNKWGCIDKEGNIVIQIIYDELQDFFKGKTTIRKNGERIKVFGLARYKKGKKRGYVDKQGKEYWQYWKDERDFRKSRW